MAKKRIETVEGVYDIFTNIMERGKIINFKHYNDTLIGYLTNDSKLIFKIGSKLLDHILINKKDIIQELDISKTEDKELVQYIDSVLSNYSDQWVGIDGNELYTGKIIEISIKDYMYPLFINKDSFMYKLRKSEFENIQYRVFKELSILSLCKKYLQNDSDLSFDVIKLYKIL